jgi:hypothetical protein
MTITQIAGTIILGVSLLTLGIYAYVGYRATRPARQKKRSYEVTIRHAHK